MPQPILIDTAYVLALVNAHDQNHLRALSLVSRYDNASLVVTDAVLLEIGAALAYRFRREAIAIIEEFRSSPTVELVHLTPGLFDQAFALYKSRDDKQWSLVDCISFVVMYDRGITQALTFDQHFQQAGFTALMRESE